jgi:aminopeptidase N
MKDAQPRTILHAQYRPPAFLIEQTELYVDLHEDYAQVCSELTIVRNLAEGAPQADDLVLNGVELELQELSLDGTPLATDRYRVQSESLTVRAVPERFVLRCVTRCQPRQNKSLEGLYSSRQLFCTQCEAEGFRKITYYLDRPDVLSRFSTTIEAEQARYPVLLSNGNPVHAQQLEGGRHRVRWEDPFAKPCYLFALVAGDLCCVEESYVTASGREVDLQIFVEHKDLDKCAHAMTSLKRAMRWDEEVYGREYDLDIYMIVAVDDFNMGAMENKGLNIFNTSCVLANPALTTDASFQRIEGIIAHEYFHNWSGNRVTCRDWFQLSLKEGFTVFRDACFSADLNSATVKRVEDVKLLRTAQFAEDAGPTAHPIRPESYIEISNFYTLTIYEKGAEVVRMLHTLLGAADFRRGSDLYFERHDGQAATCEDFVAAMAQASGRDLTQFRYWYSQVGTPTLRVTDEYHAERAEYTLIVEQESAQAPGSAGQGADNASQALHIPLSIGLLTSDGPIALRHKGAAADDPVTLESVLELTERSQRFTFHDVPEKPIPSLLRGFSAPVKLVYDYSDDDLRFLMVNDSDGFNCWDACQSLAMGMLQRMIEACSDGAVLPVDPGFVAALQALLVEPPQDKAMLALMLQLPSEAYLAEEASIIEVAPIHRARRAALRDIGLALAAEFKQLYRDNQLTQAYQPQMGQIGRRRLKNECLVYLAATGDESAVDLCERQFHNADNMTDVLAALSCLLNMAQTSARAVAEEALAAFYQRWQHEPLAVNLWFQVQATSTLPGALQRVQQLMQHPAYDPLNPNKVRALVAAFCQHNAVNFHADSGDGYRFLSGQVQALDADNPQLAARLLTPLTRWRRYPQHHAQLMRSALEELAALDKLSPDVYEIVSKSLS